jgi:hypothetical protein
MDLGISIAVDIMHMLDLGIVKSQLLWTLQSLTPQKYRVFYARTRTCKVDNNFTLL